MEKFLENTPIPWVKVTDPSSGKIYYSTATHEYPQRKEPDPTPIQNVIIEPQTTFGSGSVDTGSLLTNASFLSPDLTFTKGDGSTFDVDISTLTVISASYAATASYFSGSVLNVTSASYALTASYAQNSTLTSAISGTTNYISKFISGTTIGNSVIFESGSNIGIGTTSPTHPLHVRGTYPQIRLANSGIGEEGIITALGTLAKTNSTTATFTYGPLEMSAVAQTMTFSGTNVHFGNITTGYIPKRATIGFADSLIYDNGARIGIGTTTPGANLEVNGNVFASSFTGSLLGTASYATQALSASFATTASYVLNAVSSSRAISASFATTASYVLNAVSSSRSVSSSFATTASYALNAVSASRAVSASFATTASLATSVQVFKTTTSGFYPVTFVSSSANGLLYQYQYSDFYYDPGTSTLSVSNISSNLLGTASYATNHAVITSSYICDGILTANQTFATGSDVIIAFIDYLDPNGWLTSNQFKPTIAGYYNISFGVWLQNPGISSNQVNTQMRKNGNSMILSQQPLNNGTGIGLGGSRIIQMNGTTDYIDWTIFQGSGDRSTGTLLQGTVNGSGTWFSAFLLTQ